MIKHKLLAVIFTGILLGACTKTSPPVKVEPTQIPEKVAVPTVKTMTWTDEAGFVFSYPEDIKITPNASDNDSYANLTATDGVKIMAVDSKYKSVADWVKGEAKFKDGVIIDSELSGKMGKKVVKNGVITAGIIDDNILFTIEYGADSKSGPQILDTFTLTYPTPKPATKTAPVDTGDEVVLEEEVVE